MEYVLKTKRIRKKTKHWRESRELSNLEGKKFIQSDTLDAELYIFKGRK